jgi:hypothetical protein
VWRDWVLNEAGDYIGVREEYDEPHNFDALFGAGEWIARRRRFEPCLSLEEDGHPRGHTYGIYIEWRDLGAEDKEWKPIDTLSPEGREVIVFDRECGIRFNGEMPPYELRTAEKPEIRVTASVDSDTRVTSLDEPHKSLLQGTKRLLLNVGGKFKYRKRSKDSKFAQEGFIVSFSPSTTEADDTSLIADASKSLLSRGNSASVAGTVKLFGLEHPTAQVGAIATGIPGRKLGFRVDAGNDLVNARFPTVVGLRFNFQDQSLDLVLDTFRGRGGI